MAKDHHFDARVGRGAHSTSHRESDDRYAGALYTDGRWRVAVCRDGTQFLLQRQRLRKSGVGGAWDSLRYCMTRAALIRDWHALTGDLGLVLIDLLPERATMLTRQAERLSGRHAAVAGPV